MIYVQNAAAVQRQINAWMEKRKKQAEDVARGLAIAALERFLDFSPQFSGDFAAGWRVSINTVDYTFEGYPGPITVGGRNYNEVFQMGDSPAQRVALERNAGRLDSFKLGDTVYISNSAGADEPYAVKIENGEINFRPVNQGAPVERGLRVLATQWSHVSPASARVLSRKKL